MSSSTIGSFIRDRRKALGLTLTDLQERTGINNGNLSKIERGLQSLTNETMTALAGALNVTLAELFSSDGATVGQLEHTSGSDGQHYRFVSEYGKLTDIAQEENVAIGSIVVRPDATHGGVTCSVDNRHAHVFHGGSIREIAAQPTELASHQIADDAMAPRLYAGDTVVVNLGEKAIPPAGGVFAVSMDDSSVVIRRLIPYVGGGVRIRCDNPDTIRFPEMTLNGSQASSLTIIGRVKHMRGTAGF